jgi:hypothetical protein
VQVVEIEGANPFTPGLAESGGQRRFSQQHDDRIPERCDVSRVLDQQSTVQMFDLLKMTPTALATTGRAFHIASVAPSPNPSCKLFLTTTAAWR